MVLRSHRVGGVDGGLGSPRFVCAGVREGLEFPILISGRPPPAGYRRVTRPPRFMARRSAAFSFLVAMLRRLPDRRVSRRWINALGALAVERVVAPVVSRGRRRRGWGGLRETLEHPRAGAWRLRLLALLASGETFFAPAVGHVLADNPLESFGALPARAPVRVVTPRLALVIYGNHLGDRPCGGLMAAAECFALASVLRGLPFGVLVLLGDGAVNFERIGPVGNEGDGLAVDLDNRRVGCERGEGPADEVAGAGAGAEPFAEFRHAARSARFDEMLDYRASLLTQPGYIVAYLHGPTVLILLTVQPKRGPTQFGDDLAMPRISVPTSVRRGFVIRKTVTEGRVTARRSIHSW